MEASVVRVGSHDVRVLDAGDGPCVTVLHGWGGRIESMAPVIGCLQDDFRVISIDFPGFGESPLPTEVWGTPQYADLIAILLGERDVERSSFVGHSFGAKTSLHVAASRPSLVDRLILVGSSGLRSAPSMKARAKRALSKSAKAVGRLGGPGRRVRDAVFDRIASEDYKQAGPMKSIFVRIVNEDVTEILPRVLAPTLLVWGSKDDAVPLAHARTMERLIPDAGLVVFEGAGHFAYLDEPDRFCTVARHFLGASD
jgi:pimeloyl-ACP methyl ester carboxylesterase